MPIRISTPAPLVDKCIPIRASLATTWLATVALSAANAMRGCAMSNHRGTFIGAATREHGMSRQHHHVIATDVGGEVYCAEAIELQPGMRVSFDFHAGSGEQMAVNVRSITPPPAPAEQTPQQPAKPTKRRGGEKRSQ